MTEKIIRWLIIMAVMSGLLCWAWPAFCGNVISVAQGTSAYGIDIGYTAYSFSVKAHDADVSVETFLSGTQQDSFLVEMEVPGTFVTACDSINIIRTTSTRVTVNLGFPHGRGPAPGFGGTSMKITDIENITLVDGYDLGPAPTYMTFPLPLVPMGQKNYAALSFYATAWPDTVFYQVVLANSMMDSTSTVFNFGSADDTEYMRYFIPANFGADMTALTQYLENAGAGWIPSGAYVEGAHYDVKIQNASGYPGIAKFIGVRVGTDADDDIEDLQVILHLGTIAESAGD